MTARSAASVAAERSPASSSSRACASCRVPAASSNGHLDDRLVGGGLHRLRLADGVLGVVEDFVDATRELEDVLQLERGREGIRQRFAQLALAVVATVLALAQAFGRRGIAARPGEELVHPLDRDRGLFAQHPQNVCGSRQEPVRAFGAFAQIALQITSIIAPSAAAAGRVRIQAKAIERTTAQRT